MAKTDRFYIGQLEGDGLNTSLRQYAIPDNAFSSLNNAYVFRGRVKKRFGSKLMRGSTGPAAGFESLQSRLRIALPGGNNVGTTTAGGNATSTVPGTKFKVGQLFSIGTQLFTVQTTGTPTTMKNSTGLGTGTYNTTSGAYVFTGVTPGTQIYFYPAEPVMGLPTYQVQTVLDELVFAFDTQFAYQYLSTGWDRLGTATWTGSNSQFFWGSTYRGPDVSQNYLWVTNYKAGTNLNNSDPMYFWDGSSWNVFNPRFDPTVATSTIVTARIIYPYKGRLVLLNTVENTGVAPGVNATYVNRVRYSWLGDPTASTAFYDDPQYGSYEDAPTQEAIVAAQFLKDRLIVYFEQSTWELVYTNNEIRPFVWQQINTEFGAESTFSQVPFDKVVLGIGNVGIIACNGSNVDRIDEKIPDTVFDIHNEDNGIARVAGIRDYEVETVYWTFPAATRSAIYPFNNKVLVYNYKNSSWALNDDSITAFGYYQPEANEGETWESDTGTWESDTSTWQDGVDIQPRFRTIIAGNQEGFVFIIDPYLSRNSPSLQITKIFQDPLLPIGIITISCINHNLEPGFNATGDYVYIENCLGSTIVNGNIYAVNSVIDANTFTIVEPFFTGAYLGAGTLARVSNINIITKQYNFYANQGRNALINKVDFLVDKTTNGQITVDYALSSSSESTLFFGQQSKSLLGTGVLETSPYVNYGFINTTDSSGNASGTITGDIGTTFKIVNQIFTVVVANGAMQNSGPGTATFNVSTGAYTFSNCTPLQEVSIGSYAIPFEQTQERLWHPIYPIAEGECIQLMMYMNDAQLRNVSIAFSDFELHAQVYYTQVTSSRLQ